MVRLKRTPRAGIPGASGLSFNVCTRFEGSDGGPQPAQLRERIRNWNQLAGLKSNILYRIFSAPHSITVIHLFGSSGSVFSNLYLSIGALHLTAGKAHCIRIERARILSTSGRSGASGSFDARCNLSPHPSSIA